MKTRIDHMKIADMRIDEMKAVESRQRIYACLPYVLLTALTAALLFMPMKSGDFFGSEGDWLSQHVRAAETLRQTIAEQGTVFIQHVNIGGGSNAYDLAYYGLLRPDILISCLFMQVPMKYIIAAYAALGAAASVNLAFAWLKRKGLGVWFSAAGAVMTAAATCFLHAHHQIMFVNYMPFLFTALIGIDIFTEKRRSMTLIISLFMICIHSFFYSPACLFVCLIYCLYRLKEVKAEDRLKAVLHCGASVISAVGMAAVLLIPAGMDILSTEKDGGSFADSSLKALDLSMEGLLYSSYSCGLTLLALYGLVMALYNKRMRGISSAVLACLVIPAVSLVLSGFLYARGKILIPFLPLVVWICAETFRDIFEERHKLKIVPALLCAVPAFYSQWKLLILAESLIILIWAVLGTAGGGAKQKAASKTVIPLLLSVSLGVSYMVNSSGDYIKEEDTEPPGFELEEIEKAAEDKRYRFDYLAGSYMNSNLLPSGNMNKAAMYSSVSNSTYSRFFYDTMRNPIIARNRVALAVNENIFFNYFIGIRYVLTSADRIPFGYEKVAEREGFVIAENENVLPICYGAYDLLAEEEYEQMEFPQNMTALAGSRAEKIEAQIEDNKIKLSQAVENQVLIISFDIDRRDGKEVVISVEDMKNKLSSEDAAYPNENYSFTYVIAGEGKVQELELTRSKGDYDIENLTVYKADLPKIDYVTPVFYSELDAGQVFSGFIEMEQDGYFVTSIPYKDGYSIYVDGEKTDAQKVNTAFIGFELKKGGHSIEITYTAPGFWAGMALSLLSFALAGIIISRERKNRT